MLKYKNKMVHNKVELTWAKGLMPKGYLFQTQKKVKLREKRSAPLVNQHYISNKLHQPYCIPT